MRMSTHSKMFSHKSRQKQLNGFKRKKKQKNRKYSIFDKKKKKQNESEKIDHK